MPIFNSLLDLVDSVLGNGVQALDDLVQQSTVLETLNTDLLDQIDETVDTITAILDTTTAIVDDLNAGSSVISTLEPLNQAIADINTLLPALSTIDSSAVDQLEATLTDIADDFGVLTNNLLLLSPDAVRSMLTPLNSDLTALDNSLVDGLLTGLAHHLAGPINDSQNDGSVLQGLLSVAGVDAANAVNDIFGYLESWVNTLPKQLSDPTMLATDLQETVDGISAAVGLLQGFDATHMLNGLTTTLEDLETNLSNIVGNINDGSVPSLTELTNALEPIATDISDVVNSLIDVPVGKAADSLLDNFLNDTALVDDLIQELGSSVVDLESAVGSALTDLLGVQQDVLDGIESPQNLVDKLSSTTSTLDNLITELQASDNSAATPVITAIGEIVDSLQDVVTDLTDGTIPLAAEVLNTVNPIVDDLQALTTALPDDVIGGGTNGSTNGSTNGGTNGSTNGSTNGGTNGSTNGGTGKPTNSETQSSITYGTNGNDSFSTTSSRNRFDMRAGNDVVTSSYANLKQKDEIDGGAGVDKFILTGGSKADVFEVRTASTLNAQNLFPKAAIAGTSVSNFEQFDLSRFSGRAIFRGSGSDDIAITGRGKDLLIGGEGADQLQAGKGKDKLIGDAGNDILVGDGGRDKLFGGAGNDLLMGGRGKDRLVGGAGNDSYGFTSIKDKGDKIKGFERGDQIVISKDGFSRDLDLGKLSANQFVLGRSAQDTDDYFIYNSQNNTLYFDADAIGGKEQVAIAQFSGDPSLTASSIIII